MPVVDAEREGLFRPSLAAQPGTDTLRYGSINEHTNSLFDILEPDPLHELERPELNEQLAKDFISEAARHQRDTRKVDLNGLARAHLHQVVQLYVDRRASNPAAEGLCLVG